MNPVVGRMLVAAVASAAATAALALPTVVQADWISCTNGKYAIALPRHLSTLRTIGRHRIVDREVRSGDGQTASARTIEYFGLRLDVAALPGDPTRIRFLAAESISRRWDIGRLSVGATPPDRWSTSWCRSTRSSTGARRSPLA